MPKTKKSRKASTSDSDSGPDDRTPMKKSKPAPSAPEPKSSGEELSWDLGKNKFLKLSEFKGKWYVNIREFYLTSDGELKPGKKGIMLTMEQYQKFKSSLPELDEAIKKNV